MEQRVDALEDDTDVTGGRVVRSSGVNPQDETFAIGTLCCERSRCGKEASGTLSEGVSPTGGRTTEPLREHRGAIQRTGGMPDAAVQVAMAVGAEGCPRRATGREPS